MEAELFKSAIGNGIWAALFVYLLWYVLKTTGEREKRLIACIDKLADQFGIVDHIKAGVDRLEQKIGTGG